MNYPKAKKKRLVETIRQGCDWSFSINSHVYTFRTFDANSAIIDYYSTNSRLDCLILMIRIVWVR